MTDVAASSPADNDVRLSLVLCYIGNIPSVGFVLFAEHSQACFLRNFVVKILAFDNARQPLDKWCRRRDVPDSLVDMRIALT